ncbi:ankyrin repeat and LEM domain-containing protein 1 [Chamaea fasciata]|uniref:ankyrin repeat and LEM domain-containing protein 1 n=1 Tax=Chamaea fasciata TaxID=190680 RepID=UPI003369CEA3
MSGACARELPPLEVAAARGCRRCLGLLLRGQEPLAPQSGPSRAQGEVPKVSPPPRGQSQTPGVTSSLSPEPRWPRRVPSFQSEDGSGDSDTAVAFGDIPEAAALSGTRRSRLHGPGDSGATPEARFGDKDTRSPPVPALGTSLSPVPVLPVTCPRGSARAGCWGHARCRSRLRAAAARFCSSSSSSSSSSFPETLPRCPSVPRVAVTSPPGRCVTAGDRDVSAADGEGTGGSRGDTRIVHGLSPRGGSDPRPGPGVLRGLGDKGHPQNCSGSQPRGLGDKGHPQTSLPPARGSPKASARLRPLPGNRRHPRKSPCVTRGVPSATSEPEGGTGWQRPSPLATPSVPLSPVCATRRSESHREDVTQELAPRQCHSPGGVTGATSSPGGGRVSLGDNPGPVTAWGQRGWPQGHSPELLAALRTGCVPDCAEDELALTGHYERPERDQAWPGERLKSSFSCLLLDPRCVTAHLPGPGSGRGGPKVWRILEIWALGQGAVPVQCFQHRVPAEALTRESCMLEALGLQALTNARRGPCYGVAVAWPGPWCRRLGVFLLHRALGVLLAEGECQIHPGDVPGVTPSAPR